MTSVASPHAVVRSCKPRRMSPSARAWNKLLNRMGYQGYHLARDYMLELREAPGLQPVEARPDLACDGVYVFTSGHLAEDYSAGARETREGIARKVKQCLRRGVAAIWIDGSLRRELNGLPAEEAKRRFDRLLATAQKTAARLLRKFEHDGTPVATIDTRKPHQRQPRKVDRYVQQPRSRRQRRQLAIAMT